MDSQMPTTSWRTTTLITVTVILTVLFGLGLAYTDHLFLRQFTPLSTLPEAILIGTATPADIITLSTSTTTPPPTSPTPTSEIERTPQATAVAMQPICQVIPGWVSYIVRPGDTLSSLAVRSGATISELRQANCLENSLILAGMTIYLPATPPDRPVCGPPSHWVRYQVQAGDTKYGLARSRGITIYALDLANCFRPLLAGSYIFLPPLAATSTPIATNTATATVTATAIATSTTTPTTTPTATSIITATATATGTPLPPSPTVTAAATLAPSSTPTALPTAMPTSTPTPVETMLPTATPTATSTPLPTSTPTNTPISPTATATATAVSP